MMILSKAVPLPAPSRVFSFCLFGASNSGRPNTTQMRIAIKELKDNKINGAKTPAPVAIGQEDPLAGTVSYSKEQHSWIKKEP
jgi:hypothetical protein